MLTDSLLCRECRWRVLLDMCGSDDTAIRSLPAAHELFMEAEGAGIPTALRADVWMVMTGAASARKRHHHNYYHDLV